MRAMGGRLAETVACREGRANKQRGEAIRGRSSMRWLLILALVAGCGADVHVSYPGPPVGAATGSLILVFSSTASDVYVALDGVLVVQDEHTDHVRIDNILVGNTEVVITANGADRALHVWVGSDHPTTVPLGIADASPGFLKTVFASLISIVAYSLLH